MMSKIVLKSNVYYHIYTCIICSIDYVVILLVNGLLLLVANLQRKYNCIDSNTFIFFLCWEYYTCMSMTINDIHYH